MLKFTKMHGLGNDFMVIDLVRQSMPISPHLVQRLSNRNFGVGFDQLLIVEPPTLPEVDFKYRIFNADGSEVEQCGNGARCFAVFVRQVGLTTKQHIVVETLSGIMHLYVSDQNWVRVNMGLPRFEPEQIPFIPKLPSASPHIYPIEIEGKTIEMTLVNIGNPHAVIIVPNVIEAEVYSIGAAIEKHPQFPERVNVGFLEILNRQQARLRVFERGAGETIACGSGACAAIIAGIQRGLLDEQVEVQLAGGFLTISWKPEQPVWMTGPTATVYEGEIAVEDFWL